MKLATICLAVTATVSLGACDSGGARGPGGPAPFAAEGGRVSSLTGTWDLTYVRPSGRTQEMVVDLHPDFVSIIDEAHLLLLRRSPDGWDVQHRGYTPDYIYPYGCPTSYRTAHPRSSDIAATRSEPTALDTGELPIDLGGRWRVAGSSSSGCDLAIGADAVELSCGSVNQFQVPWLPSLRDQRVRLLRRSAADSIFGDLGGEWSFRGDDGDAECALTIAGNRVMLRCTGRTRFPEFLELVFGDGVISGRTVGGAEIAGVRR